MIESFCGSSEYFCINGILKYMLIGSQLLLHLVVQERHHKTDVVDGFWKVAIPHADREVQQPGAGLFCLFLLIVGGNKIDHILV